MIIWLSILYMAVSISLHRDLLDSASKYRTHSYNDEAENPVIHWGDSKPGWDSASKVDTGAWAQQFCSRVMQGAAQLYPWLF